MKREMSEIDKQRMNEAFEKYDRLLDFEKRLCSLINSLSIDSLLEVPDYILAATAKQQMELTAAIIRSVKKHP